VHPARTATRRYVSFRNTKQATEFARNTIARRTNDAIGKAGSAIRNGYI
jgi:hypothetical protein